METSALLRALLENDTELFEIIRSFGRALITSRLTQIEAERTVLRVQQTQSVDKKKLQELRRRLHEFFSVTSFIQVDESVVDRACEPFLVEHVRSLDAVHLSSALLYLRRIGDVVMVSCDKQIRENAAAYGMAVVPS